MNRDITEVFIDHYGIDISVFDETFVNNNIVQRIHKTGCSDSTAYSRCVVEEKTEAEIFIESLQVSYSEFFRNPLTFAVLERIVLPELNFRMKTTKSKEIRIWSAACAGGQEAYSLAMLLENLSGQNEIGRASWRGRV